MRFWQPPNILALPICQTFNLKMQTSNAERSVHPICPYHWQWIHHHRTSLRIRLLWLSSFPLTSGGGIRVTLVNDNPATIMTDPITADKGLSSPSYGQSIVQVLEEQQIDAVLPTMGGQTALNLVSKQVNRGFGKIQHPAHRGRPQCHRTDGNREAFRQHMIDIGLRRCTFPYCQLFSGRQGGSAGDRLPAGHPPSYTLGGRAAASCTRRPVRCCLAPGLNMSPTTKCWLKKAVPGWKEFELELLRDAKDNVVIICTVENLDPMGIHPATASPLRRR